MGKIIVMILMLSAYLFGSEEAAGGTDIVARSVNFVLLMGLLFYVAAEPIKGYFTNRSAEIAGELEKVQERLKESKRLKEMARREVEKANRFAVELREHSVKENKILHDKIIAQSEQDCLVMEKQSHTIMDFEKRQMVREVVTQTMGETIKEAEKTLSPDAMGEILKRKVA